MMNYKKFAEIRRKENKYMITYFKMKRNEWKVKAMFYGIIVQIMDNQDEIKDMINLVKK